MIEKMKNSWKKITVKVGICAALLVSVSSFLPWASYGNESASIMQVYFKDGGIYTMFALMFVVVPLLVAGSFLTNHPKLTLLWNVVLIFWTSALLDGIFSTRGVNLGIGGYLGLAGILVTIICAFATKKQKKDKKKKGAER